MDNLNLNVAEMEHLEGESETKIATLTDLQLALIGGGSGDVVFH